MSKSCVASGIVRGTTRIAHDLLRTVRIFDSNVLIYYLNGIFSPQRKARIDHWIQEGTSISVITRIEVLGYSQSAQQRKRTHAFVALFREIPLTEGVVRRTISLRRQHTIKVPDAVIAATALDLEIPLVTRNTRDFGAIEGLSLLNPFED